jgi:hypothetical protein
MNVDNTRQLLLQDIVEKNKTGKSVLSEWKAIANRYYLWKRLYLASLFGSFVSLGFVFTKRGSGRLNAYLYPFIGLSCSFIITRQYYRNYVEYVKQISGEPDNERVEKAMHFHKYSLLS